jgi:membrane associated rhomboid family serine protease
MLIKIPKLVKYLIYINIGGYILTLLADLFGLHLSIYFGLVPYLVVKKYFIWQFVTYMFIHGSPWHLLFNMLMLWMFGSELCTQWGDRFFLRYYFICGIGGGLAVVGLAFMEPNSFVLPTVGASGAIFGLFLAYGIIFKDRMLYVFGIVPVKAKNLVIILGLFEFLSLLSESKSNISHLAHLGGLVVGYLYLKAKDRERIMMSKRYKNWKENMQKKKMEDINNNFEKDNKNKNNNIYWN